MSSTWITRVADTKTKTRDSCIVVFVYSLGSIMHAVVFKFLNTLIRCRVIHTNLQAVSAMHSSLKWYSRPIQSLVSLYFVPGKGCEVCDELPVNVSIHLSVCPLAQLENCTCQTSPIFSRASRMLRSATQVVRMPCVCHMYVLYVCMCVCGNFFFRTTPISKLV